MMPIMLGKGKGGSTKYCTQWAAQFTVAGELSKRGYQVALTLGNNPKADLMVMSPHGTNFLVEVKGLRDEKQYWLVHPKEKRPDLFYVFALVPRDKQNRFFVLTQDEVNSDIEKNTRRWRERDASRANKTDKAPGVSPSCAKEHEDHWQKLPE